MSSELDELMGSLNRSRRQPTVDFQGNVLSATDVVPSLAAVGDDSDLSVSPSLSAPDQEQTQQSTATASYAIIHQCRESVRYQPSSCLRSDTMESSGSKQQHISLFHDTALAAKARDAKRINDSMVYLEGAAVYTCNHCRTHLTSHDDIISKSFHGRHGRAFLFGQCVNITVGSPEERRLITGLHTVCDIFCKRCKTLVGWTYLRAFEMSQKYKEGKFIIEKINLHLEESNARRYGIALPTGVRADRWHRRSEWGSEQHSKVQPMVFEYNDSMDAED